MNRLSNPGTKRKGVAALLVVIGFLLSPLSWWNDLVINVPLALVFAWGVSWFHHDAFTVSFVAGYWLTNVLGLLLMSWGAGSLFGKASPSFDRKQLLRDLLIALLYTALIVVLVKFRVLLPLTDYLQKSASPAPGQFSPSR